MNAKFRLLNHDANFRVEFLRELRAIRNDAHDGPAAVERLINLYIDKHVDTCEVCSDNSATVGN